MGEQIALWMWGKSCTCAAPSRVIIVTLDDQKKGIKMEEPSPSFLSFFPSLFFSSHVSPTYQTDFGHFIYHGHFGRQHVWAPICLSIFWHITCSQVQLDCSAKQSSQHCQLHWCVILWSIMCLVG